MMEPASAGSHRPAAENLAAEPFSPQIHIHHIAPLLVCQVKEGNDGLDSSIVHQHVHRPKLFLYLVEHGLDLFPLAYIRFHHQCTTALALHPRSNSARFFTRSQVIDDDVRALFRKYLRNSLANSLAGSGNERYFIAQLHVHPIGSAFRCSPPPTQPVLLVDSPAAIDHQHVAHHHIGEGAGEKQHGTHQVLRLIPSSPRNHLLRGPFFVSWPFQNVLA